MTDGKVVKNKANPNGTGKFLNESGKYEFPPIFIQQTDPALATAYVWYQTDALGSLITIWINKP